MSLFILPYLSVLSQMMVVGAIAYVRRNLAAEMKILAIYFVLCFLTAVLQLSLALKGVNNLWTGEIFSPVQYAMLMYVFYVWNRTSAIGTAMFYSIPIFIAAWVIGLIWFGNAATTFNYMDPISAAVFVVVSAFTLLTLDRVEGSSVVDTPSFWISAATVIYFGSTIVLSSLGSSLLKASVPTMQLAWSVQAIINILANLLYAGGFLCLRQKT